MSKCHLASALFVSVALLAVPRAHGQMSYGVAAGVSAPVGDFGRAYDATPAVGPKTGRHIAFSMSNPARVGFRLDLLFNEFDYNSPSTARSRIVGATIDAVVGASRRLGTGPYLLAGLGVYNVSTRPRPAVGNGGGMKLGFNAGAGFRVAISGVSVFVEAKYHYIGTDPFGSRYEFKPVSLGVAF